MNLPNWVSRRSPSGLMIWSDETWIPLAYWVPTWLSPNTTVEAYVAPAPARITDVTPSATMRPRAVTPNRRNQDLETRRRRRVTCVPVGSARSARLDWLDIRLFPFVRETRQPGTVKRWS